MQQKNKKQIVIARYTPMKKKTLVQYRCAKLLNKSSLKKSFRL